MSLQYRWVIVAAGGLLGCVAIGAMFALPVFLAPMSAATGWSRAGISSAMTIALSHDGGRQRRLGRVLGPLWSAAGGSPAPCC